MLYDQSLKTLCYRRYRTNLPTLLYKAVLLLQPLIEPIPVRISGRVYRVPAPISPARQSNIALKWLRVAVAGRHERHFEERYINELIDSQTAAHGPGGGVKQLRLLQQTAVLNRAFTNYR